jgi:hypothetical protein
MLGSNPSADSGTKTGAGRLNGAPLRRPSGPRNWYQGAKSQGSGDSVPRYFVSNELENFSNSKLANSYDSKLHFTLNQDTMTSAATIKPPQLTLPKPIPIIALAANSPMLKARSAFG